jgi:hypothetical protein
MGACADVAGEEACDEFGVVFGMEAKLPPYIATDCEKSNRKRIPVAFGRARLRPFIVPIA